MATPTFDQMIFATVGNPAPILLWRSGCPAGPQPPLTWEMLTRTHTTDQDLHFTRKTDQLELTRSVLSQRSSAQSKISSISALSPPAAGQPAFSQWPLPPTLEMGLILSKATLTITPVPPRRLEPAQRGRVLVGREAPVPQPCPSQSLWHQPGFCDQKRGVGLGFFFLVLVVNLQI